MNKNLAALLIFLTLSANGVHAQNGKLMVENSFTIVCPADADFLPTTSPDYIVMTGKPGIRTIVEIASARDTESLDAKRPRMVEYYKKSQSWVQDDALKINGAVGFSIAYMHDSDTEMYDAFVEKNGKRITVHMDSFKQHFDNDLALLSNMLSTLQIK